MPDLNDADLFLVERPSTGGSYKLRKDNLVADLLEADLMLVERSGKSFKATGADIKGSFVDPLALAATVPNTPQAGVPTTVTTNISGGTNPVVNSYQWQSATLAAGGAVTNLAGNGADTATYTPQTSDIGQFLQCIVGGTDDNSQTVSTTSNRSTSAVAQPVLVSQPVLLTPPDGAGLGQDGAYNPMTSDIESISAGTATGAWTAPTGGDAQNDFLDVNTWVILANPQGTRIIYLAYDNSRTTGAYSDDNGATLTKTNATAALSKYWWKGAAGTNGWIAGADSSGGLVKSSDGITWTAFTLPSPYTATDSIGGMAWGPRSGNPNGRFIIAVAETIFYSDDNAATWSQVDQETHNYQFLNGEYFVALNNSVITSPDGVNWTTTANSVTSQGSTNFTTAYGNGVYVNIQKTSTGGINTSTDGRTWALTSPAGTAPAIAVAFGNGLFLTMPGDSSNQAYTSPDGLTWTAQTVPWSANISTNSLTFTGEYFIQGSLPSDGASNVYRNPTGTTGSIVTQNIVVDDTKVFNASGGAEILDTTIKDVFKAGNKVYADSDSAIYGYLFQDADDSTRTLTLINNVGTWAVDQQIVNDTQAVAVDQNVREVVSSSTQEVSNTSTTTDAGFRALNIPGAGAPRGMAFAPSLGTNGRWVAVTYSGGSVTNNILYSDNNGLSWTSTGVDQAGWEYVIWIEEQSQFVACNSDKTNADALKAIVTSPDGINWTNRTYTAGDGAAGDRIYCFRIAYDKLHNTIAILSNTESGSALTGRGNCLYSEDNGVTWRQGTGIPNGPVFYGIASNLNGITVGVQYTNSNIYISNDGGKNYTLNTDLATKIQGKTGTVTDTEAMAYSLKDNLFICCSYSPGGCVAYSSDGATWTTYNLPTTLPQVNDSFNGTLPIAANLNGRVSLCYYGGSGSPAYVTDNIRDPGGWVFAGNMPVGQSYWYTYYGDNQFWYGLYSSQGGQASYSGSTAPYIVKDTTVKTSTQLSLTTLAGQCKMTDSTGALKLYKPLSSTITISDLDGNLPYLNQANDWVISSTVTGTAYGGAGYTWTDTFDETLNASGAVSANGLNSYVWTPDAPIKVAKSIQIISNVSYSMIGNGSVNGITIDATRATVITISAPNAKFTSYTTVEAAQYNITTLNPDFIRDDLNYTLTSLGINNAARINGVMVDGVPLINGSIPLKQPCQLTLTDNQDLKYFNEEAIVQMVPNLDNFSANSIFEGNGLQTIGQNGLLTGYLFSRSAIRNNVGTTFTGTTLFNIKSDSSYTGAYTYQIWGTNDKNAFAYVGNYNSDETVSSNGTTWDFYLFQTYGSADTSEGESFLEFKPDLGLDNSGIGGTCARVLKTDVANKTLRVWGGRWQASTQGGVNSSENWSSQIVNTTTAVPTRTLDLAFTVMPEIYYEPNSAGRLTFSSISELQGVTSGSIGLGATYYGGGLTMVINADTDNITIDTSTFPPVADGNPGVSRTLAVTNLRTIDISTAGGVSYQLWGIYLNGNKFVDGPWNQSEVWSSNTSTTGAFYTAGGNLPAKAFNGNDNVSVATNYCSVYNGTSSPNNVSGNISVAFRAALTGTFTVKAYASGGISYTVGGVTTSVASLGVSWEDYTFTETNVTNITVKPSTNDNANASALASIVLANEMLVDTNVAGDSVVEGAQISGTGIVESLSPVDQEINISDSNFEWIESAVLGTSNGWSVADNKGNARNQNFYVRGSDRTIAAPDPSSVVLASDSFILDGTPNTTDFGSTVWQIAQTDNFAAPVINKTDAGPVTSYSIPINTLSAGTEYYARVKQVATDGTQSLLNNGYSAANQFKTSGTLVNGWNAIAAAAANSWVAVVYGGDKFVVVSSDGATRVQYSSDAKTWSNAGLTGLDGSEAFTDITYGSGVFVTVANAGSDRIATSANGTAWTKRTVPTSAWQAVCYSSTDDTFVAVSDGDEAVNVITSSDDGLTWASNTTGVTGSFTSIAFGNGVYVAVGLAGALMSATDPTGTWTERVAAENNSWRSVVYGTDKFVAVSSDGTNRVMWSTDGISWTNAGLTNVDSNEWYSVTFALNKYVAVSRNGSNRVMNSADGITWVTSSAAQPNAWYDVTFGAAQFLAVSTTGADRTMWSSTGFQAPIADSGWSSVDITSVTSTGATGSKGLFRSSAYGVVSGQGIFVNLFSGETLSGVVASWSEDGITWNAGTITNDPTNSLTAPDWDCNWQTVAFGGPSGSEGFIAFSYNNSSGAIMLTSVDGKAWLAQSAAFCTFGSNLWRCITWIGPGTGESGTEPGYWICVGEDGASVFSKNGLPAAQGGTGWSGAQVTGASGFALTSVIPYIAETSSHVITCGYSGSNAAFYFHAQITGVGHVWDGTWAVGTWVDKDDRQPLAMSSGQIKIGGTDTYMAVMYARAPAEGKNYISILTNAPNAGAFSNWMATPSSFDAMQFYKIVYGQPLGIDARMIGVDVFGTGGFYLSDLNDGWQTNGVPVLASPPSNQVQQSIAFGDANLSDGNPKFIVAQSAVNPGNEQLIFYSESGAQLSLFYYQESTNRMISKANIIARYGVDPIDFDVSKIGIAMLTNDPVRAVAGFEELTNGKYRPIRDFLPQLRLRAETWSSSTTLEEGQIILYQGKLYVATTTHTTSGTFDASKFEILERASDSAAGGGY